MDACSSSSDITLKDLKELKSRSHAPLNILQAWIGASANRKIYEAFIRLDTYHARAESMGISQERAAEILNEEVKRSEASLLPFRENALERASRRLIEDAYTQD